MTVKTAKEVPGLAGMEAFFVIDQNRSSANWPLAKILQRHGDAETGFKVRLTYRGDTASGINLARELSWAPGRAGWRARETSGAHLLLQKERPLPLRSADRTEGVGRTAASAPRPHGQHSERTLRRPRCFGP